MKANEYFAPYLQEFFIRYLPVERRLSQHTIHSYRDTFTVFFNHLHKRRNQLPSQIKLVDVDSTVIIGFLNHLEKERDVSAKTRNHRLTALKTFYKFMILRKIELSLQIQQILAIPSKRQEKRYIDYLTKTEETALVSSLKSETERDIRDSLIIRVMLATGVRVSELTALMKKDIEGGNGYFTLHIFGKGRKHRQTPIKMELFESLQKWCAGIGPDDIVFKSIQKTKLTTNGVQYILDKYVAEAKKSCPSIGEKNVSNHVLRHTCAMRLLEAGVPLEVIALWLGHESTLTTDIYITSSLEIKQRVLEKNSLPNHPGNEGLFKPDDELLRFLKQC